MHIQQLLVGPLAQMSSMRALFRGSAFGAELAVSLRQDPQDPFGVHLHDAAGEARAVARHWGWRVSGSGLVARRRRDYGFAPLKEYRTAPLSAEMKFIIVQRCGFGAAAESSFATPPTATQGTSVYVITHDNVSFNIGAEEPSAFMFPEFGSETRASETVGEMPGTQIESPLKQVL